MWYISLILYFALIINLAICRSAPNSNYVVVLTINMYNILICSLINYILVINKFIYLIVCSLDVDLRQVDFQQFV